MALSLVVWEESSLEAMEPAFSSCSEWDERKL